MHPKELHIEDFSYELPDERVAKFPLKERDQSRLLVYKQGEIITSTYRNVDAYLPENSLLVFNDTKVVEARILFQKATGARIEVFCLEPDERYPDITTAMISKRKVWWKCLIGGASKWKHGMKLEKWLPSTQLTLTASIAQRLSDCFVIEFEWNDQEMTFAEVLHQAGVIPLPPYLHREAQEADKETYQTIYAKEEGSVAAPTAGLHFTNAIFEKLAAKNIKTDFVTLHVGAGTFKPVQAEKLEEHEMHAEFMEVSVANVRNLIEHLDRIIVAVGTTSLRTIESLYWIGLKLDGNPYIKQEDLQVDQWAPYETFVETTSPQQALQNVLDWMTMNCTERIITKTQILIAPDYKLKIAKGIITNFHQPQSTLLLLIAAIIGEEWKRIYQYALDHEFRFLSYGDGCLLWKR